MQIELFYIDKDENFKKSFKNVKEAVKEYSKKHDFKTLEIKLVRIDEKNFKEMRFPGHPTIRINGKDLEDEDENFTLEKRSYESEGKEVTFIPLSLLKKGIEEYIDASIEAQKMKGETPNQIC